MSDEHIRILNVNDHETSRSVTEEMLRQGGFEVVSVDNGGAALSAARDDIDVVLLDVQLPDFDGYEVCRRLKADPETANLIVLLSSATSVTTNNKITGLDSGADGYLVQPYEPAELFATLRSLLRARAAERRAQALADELRLAMAVRDEFLAMLGHELRNPLATMTTALEMLHMRRDPASLDRYLPLLGRQTANLAHIVDDLLDIARITHGKVTIRRDVVDLVHIVEKCVDGQRDAARRAEHTIVLKTPGAPVCVVGDAVRLDQIANNLLTNAIKYTPQGGQITVSVSAVGEHARLDVLDNGIGMTAELRARVFDVFVQAKQGMDRAPGGLGLGLAVVRNLVELHGGKVTAASDGTGTGSCFSVQLPLARASSESSSPKAEGEGERTAGARIVVIDDNEDMREMLCEALEGMDYEVHSAGDGKQGLELVLALRPDIALVDIGLPEMDGYAVAREIHARCNGAAPRLIAMTGYGQPADRARTREAGFGSHLVKPVSLAQLETELRRVSAD
ncbi:MAG TPA: response regulator [Kofleriaceae bacterium]|nr:response regulator [Kofleriaceae bacterium]